MSAAMSGGTGSMMLRARLTTLEAVDQVCCELRNRGLAQLPREERFAVELLVREALANALLHGSAAKEVWCEVERLECGVAVRVGDDGEGFDWRSWLHSAADSKAESGRGVNIMRRYSSALRFNEKGNLVEAIRIFSRGGEHG
ncbi:MAG TPA: ATP-binding protein [Bryobacteraceae bacterium]|nr:ATP-binding protein [Bryobacteraceae bacterium]